MKPIVSVCMITYNQEKYIAQALESALMQQTSFEYEIVIGEDCSTDNTKEILKDYKIKFPEKINLILNEPNLGIMPNLIQTLKACKGKYIAFLEGDDYWTDNKKLQKQVDFLEMNPSYSLCFHNAIITDEKYPDKVEYFNLPPQKKISTILDVIRDWFVASASMMLRKEHLEIPQWFSNVYNGDYAIQLLIAEKGPFGYLDDVMCVYRKNLGGLNSTMDVDAVLNHKIDLLKKVDKHFNSKYRVEIANRINEIEKAQKTYHFRKKYPFVKYMMPSKYFRYFSRLSSNEK